MSHDSNAMYLFIGSPLLFRKCDICFTCLRKKKTCKNKPKYKWECFIDCSVLLISKILQYVLYYH